MNAHSARKAIGPARVLTCVALPLLVALAPARAADLLRSPWRSYEAGVAPAMAPNSIVTGDVDDDGDADALLGLYFFGGPGIAVVKGDGRSAFRGFAR